MNNRNRCASAIALDSCGCQGGTDTLTTPLARNNRPGLPELSYRIGTHASFLETMKARLSSNAFPELKNLTARDSSDPSIALLDAWAMVADVLTFYQERIANEGYIRTATEERSIQELARLVRAGQRSGVAATVPLAYTIDPNTKGEVVIPAGSRVQSVPGQNEKPQTFETSEDLKAYAELNLLQPRMSRAQSTILKEEGQEGADGRKQKIPVIYLKGVHTNLKIDDRMLIAHENSEEKTRKECLYRVAGVETDAKADRTRIVLDVEQGMEDRAAKLNSKIQRVYAFRTKTATFGHNAPLKPTIMDENKIMRYSEWHIDNPTLSPDMPEIDFTYKVDRSGENGNIKLILKNISTNREFIKSIEWILTVNDEKCSREFESRDIKFSSYPIEGLSYQDKVLVQLKANLTSYFTDKNNKPVTTLQTEEENINLSEMIKAPIIDINIPNPPFEKVEDNNFQVSFTPKHSIENHAKVEWSWSIDKNPSDTRDGEDFTVAVVSGDYNVTLSVKNYYENWSSVCSKKIRVYDEPISDFSYSLVEAKKDNFIVKLTNVSTGEIDRITWKSENGKIKGDKIHDHSVDIIFPYQSNYDVYLSVDGPGSNAPVNSKNTKIGNLLFFSEEDIPAVNGAIKVILLIDRSVGNYTDISFSCISIDETGKVKKDNEDTFSFITEGDYMVVMTGIDEGGKKQVYSKMITVS